MPKPINEMDAKEINVRLLELKVEEDRLWCQVQQLRLERSELELALANLGARR